MTYESEFKVTSHQIAKEILGIRIEKSMEPSELEKRNTRRLLKDHDNSGYMQPVDNSVTDTREGV